MRDNRLRVFCAFTLFSITFFVHSQPSWLHKRLYDAYYGSVDISSNKIYGYSYFTFDNFEEQLRDRESVFAAFANFSRAQAAYQLLNNDAIHHLLTFLKTYPQNGYAKNAQFYLANIEFRNKRYSKSLEIYRDIDAYHLSDEELNEYYFKYGYSTFMMEDYATARTMLNKVAANIDSPYSSAAKYYLGHIAYAEKNYSVALSYFNELKNDNNFGSIVPYYIVQIYYYQEKYNELIEYAEPLVAEAVASRLPEIILLLAESYFVQKNYAQALKYYQSYLDKTKTTSLDPITSYKIGYCYYQAGRCDQAIQYFQRSIGVNDSITQNAHYHIGYCYINTGNKKFARTAFHEAYKIGKNPILTEDALFHFAKLSYELDMNPYNEAIRALIDYITTYPQSHRVDEAYDLLINLYFQTRNYREALASIEKIRNPNEKFLQAYQQLAYYHGVDLFLNKKFTDAIDAFKKSQKYPYDRPIYAESIFWTAEAFYQMNLIDSALFWYQQFQKNPFSARTEYLVLSYYSLGYCYFQKKQYDRAITQFRLFLERYKKQDEILQDAYVRLADCFLVQKRFDDALTYYDRAYNLQGNSRSYALFQRGIVKGIKKDYQGKIQDLKAFTNTYRNDPLFVEAIYETAFTYELLEDYTNAISLYQNIIQNYKTSPHRVRAMKKLGLLYYKLERNSDALALLQKAVEEFPGSDEAREAMYVIRNIYTEQGDPEGFIAYTQRLGATLGVSEQDSISYTAAENLFFRGDCASASQAFDRYIKNFPQGAFLLNAHFYKAECDFTMKRYDQALRSYEYVIGNPWNRFSERSLINAAQIHYINKNFAKAAEYYSMLEEKATTRDNLLLARLGVMRSFYQAKHYRKAITAAEKVLQMDSREHNHEARAIMGVAYFEIEDYPASQQQWQELIRLNNEYAAQAYYYQALINYRIGRPAEAERLIFELMSKLPSYEYWIARSFLVLADIYADRGDYYQARHALQGVIDNYEGVDIVAEARQKLQNIEQMQNRQ